MEPNKVLDLGQDSLGQRVAQKVSSVAETAGRKVDAAVGYVDKAKSEVTHSLDKMKGVGFDGLKEKVVDYARREPLTALAAAAAAGILLAWVTRRQTAPQLHREPSVHSNDEVCWLTSNLCFCAKVNIVFCQSR